MMQNRGNYAKVKQVPPQPSSIWGENVGKIYSTWNPGSFMFLSFAEHCRVKEQLQVFPFTTASQELTLLM